MEPTFTDHATARSRERGLLCQYLPDPLPATGGRTLCPNLHTGALMLAFHTPSAAWPEAGVVMLTGNGFEWLPSC